MRRQRWFGWLLLALGGLVAWEYLSLPDPTALGAAGLGAKFPGNPQLAKVSAGHEDEWRRENSLIKKSSIIRLRQKENPSLLIHQHFVPLEHISPQLRRAVVLGEDARFWDHQGIDWVEVKAAANEAVRQRRLGRGASTITQQLARTLYLSPERTLTRKFREWLIAGRLERALDKRRILELYLNHVEWGNGIFGAEAAARAYFNKSAARIDAAEAAILTAMLPAPLKRHPDLPSPAFRRRAQQVGRLVAGPDEGLRQEIGQRIDALLSGGK